MLNLVQIMVKSHKKPNYKEHIGKGGVFIANKIAHLKSSADELPKEKNWFQRHPIWTILIALFLFGQVLSLAKYDSPKNQNVAQINSYSFGEGILIGEFKYTFTNVRVTPYVGGSYVGKSADGEYLIFDLTVENVGNEAKYINDEIFIIDNLNREFDQDSSSWAYLENNIILKKLNPGLIKEAQIIFDVPEGTVGKLCLKKSAISSNCAAYVEW